MAAEDFRSGTASGYVCPTCGGALWQQRNGSSPRFRCHVGHAFEALDLWIAHCEARNAALLRAATAVAENAALARELAEWALLDSNPTLAARMEAEAVAEDDPYRQIETMLDGLRVDDSASSCR